MPTTAVEDDDFEPKAKRQKLIPFPRIGKRQALIPFPRTGKRSGGVGTMARRSQEEEDGAGVIRLANGLTLLSGGRKGLRAVARAPDTSG